MEAQHINQELNRFNYLIAETNAAYHEASLRLGLSDSAMQILYTVCNYGEECLLSDIIRLSGISKQTANSALRKLEQDGIVYLEAVNGKMKKVCLTSKGKVLAEKTALRLIALENEIYTSWTQEELALYVDLTQRYLAAFKGKVKELPL